MTAAAAAAAGTGTGVARSGRRLRGVFGPADGETFHSWMVRVAAAKGVPLNALFHRLGLREWQVQRRGESVYGLRLSDRDTERLTVTTGATVAQVRGTELLVFDGGPADFGGFDPANPATVRRVAATQTVSLRTWKVCPACVAEDGVIRLGWHLGLVFGCPHHGVLVDRCPGCGLPIGLGRPGRLFPSRPDQLLPVGCCSNLVPVDGTTRGDRRRQVCGFDLSTAPMNVGFDSSAVSAVTAAAAVLDRAVAAWLASEPILVTENRLFEFPAAPDLFALLRALTSLHAYADTAEHTATGSEAFNRWVERRDSGDQSTVVNWSMEPRDVAVVAAVVPNALATLKSWYFGNMEPVRSLAARVCARRRRFHHKVEVEHSGFGLPSSWAPSWAEACRQAQPGFVAAARRRSAARSWTATLDYVPGLWQHEREIAELRELVPGLAEDTAAEFLSLLVAHTISDKPWDALGAALGYPTGEANKVIEFATRKVREAGTRDAVWDLAWRLACRIDKQIVHGGSLQLCNYGQARRFFAAWTDMGADAWDQVVMCSDIHPGRTDARRRNATAFVWAIETGGHPHWAPGLQPTAGGPSQESLRENYRQFVRWLPENTARFLDDLWAIMDWPYDLSEGVA